MEKFEEHEVVLYNKKECTIIHMYKLYSVAVVEFDDNSVKDVPLEDLKKK